MKSSFYTSSVFLFLFLGCLVAVSEAATFTCNATTTTTCQSIIGYVSTNASTYGSISTFFQVPLASILGANNLSMTTPSTTPVSAGSTVKILVPCLCAGGIGRSDHIPVYTVVSGDDLDAISRNKFDLFINFTEVANANNISDPSIIQIGQKLWIPLPCSCDPVEEQKVVHLAYKVKSGDNTSSIAATFAAEGGESTLLQLNGISDPKKLMADQILDVPLKACASSINDTSPDHGLLLPSDTYAFTARDCVKCSCSSSSYVLDCSLASNKNSTCPAATCSGNLTLGESSGTGCDATICAYGGYSNTTSFKILTTTTTDQTSCKNAAASHMGPASSAWMKLVVLLHLILTSICIL